MDFVVGDKVTPKATEELLNLSTNRISKGTIYTVMGVRRGDEMIDIVVDSGETGSVYSRRFDKVKVETMSDFEPGEIVELIRMYDKPYSRQDVGEKDFGKPVRYVRGPYKDENGQLYYYVTIGDSDFQWHVREIAKVGSTATRKESKMTLDEYKNMIAEYVTEVFNEGDICQDGYEKFMEFAGLKDKMVQYFEMTVTLRLDTDAVRALGFKRIEDVDRMTIKTAISEGSISEFDFEVEDVKATQED